MTLTSGEKKNSICKHLVQLSFHYMGKIRYFGYYGFHYHEYKLQCFWMNISSVIDDRVVGTYTVYYYFYCRLYGKGYTESMWLYAVEFNWKVRRRNIGYVGNAYILVIEEFFTKNNIELWSKARILESLKKKKLVFFWWRSHFVLETIILQNNSSGESEHSLMTLRTHDCRVHSSTTCFQNLFKKKIMNILVTVLFHFDLSI